MKASMKCREGGSHRAAANSRTARRPDLRTVCAVLTGALLLVTATPSFAQSPRPNFVVIVVDDLGYADIAPNNERTFYETPHLNRLAMDGMRFSNAYAANPVCSPTRFSIMTGRYPSRVDATDWFAGERTGRFAPALLNDRMPESEITIAEALRDAGYRTAFLGKWHLGPTEEFWPLAQGFDVNVGGNAHGQPRSYFSPYDNPELPDGPQGEYLTTRIVDDALGLIDSFGDDPFLLFVSFYSVHVPLQAPPDLVAKYERKAAALAPVPDEFASEEQVWPTDDLRRVRTHQSHATYAAMVEGVDREVGRLIAKLTEVGIDDETVVLFTSDNGGLSTAEGSPTSNLPLRGGKGWLYEGGVRAPLIIKWPGVTRPGSSNDTPVISVDYFPTLLETAGLGAVAGMPLDGVSLVPLLRGSPTIESRPLMWHYPHYSNQGGFPGGAIRDGRYKLIERFEDGRVHLYDLEEDIGETRDLTATMPDRVRDLRERLHAWYAEVNAKFLEPLPSGPMPWRP